MVQATAWVSNKLPKGVGLGWSSSPQRGDARCLPEGWVSPGDAPALLAQSLAEISPLTCSRGRAHSITPPPPNHTIVFQETGYKGGNHIDR